MKTLVKIAPPLSAVELLEKVELVTFILPKLIMAPPPVFPVAVPVFPLKVELFMVSVPPPLLIIAPPPLAVLLEKVELVIPDYFAKALKKNKKAAEVFDKFAYSHKRDYLEWITGAKTEETRNSHMATALEWMTEGKTRHWKYAMK